MLALFPMRLLMTQNKCRLAACLCTESLWRESFISTIATLFCKFSFAESRSGFPEKRELYLVASQLISVPSASLFLQYSALFFNTNLHHLDSLPQFLLSYFLLDSKVIRILQYGNHLVCQDGVRLHSVMIYCVKGNGCGI